MANERWLCGNCNQIMEPEEVEKLEEADVNWRGTVCGYCKSVDVCEEMTIAWIIKELDWICGNKISKSDRKRLEAICTRLEDFE